MHQAPSLRHLKYCFKIRDGKSPKIPSESIIFFKNISQWTGKLSQLATELHP